MANATESTLLGLATRGLVQTGGNVLIGGFIIGGTTPKTVLVRADGPSLTAFGVPGVLGNPTMTLFSGATPIASNDDWQVPDPLCASTGHTCGSPADIAATGFAPSNPLESALLITLPPGAYTAIVSGVGGTAGVGLVSVYDQQLFATPPDVRGTYSIFGSVTQSNCLNSNANVTFGFSGNTLSIPSQSGGSFSGSGSLTQVLSGVNVRVDLSISGTIGANGQLSGTFTFITSENTIALFSGSGTFSGSLVGNTITVAASGQVLVGDTCHFTANLSGTR